MSLRLLLILAICVFILGGTALYIHTGTAPSAPAQPKQEEILGDYSLELTATFAPAPDPYALDAGVEPPPAVTVSLSGQPLYSTDTLPPALPVTIAPLPGLAEGLNEFLVTATPSLDDGAPSNAVRLRLLRGDVPLAEETFWADKGQKVVGALRVELGALQGEKP